MLKPDVLHVNALHIIPFSKNEELKTLKAELPSYLSKAEYIAVKKVLAIQLSSAAAESVFTTERWIWWLTVQENFLKAYII